MPEVKHLDNDRYIALAKRLIEKSGQKVKWRINLETPDADKPWKTQPITEDAEDKDVIIAFLPRDRLDTQLIRATDQSIPIGSVYGLMAPGDFSPSAKDTVIRDGNEIRINSIDTLSPAGVPLLYTIDFSL